MTSSISSKFTIPSQMSLSYSSEGASITATNWNPALKNNQITPLKVIEYDINNLNSNSAYIGLWKSPDTSSVTNRLVGTYLSGNTWYFENDNTNYNLGSYIGTYTLKIYSDKIECYKDNVLIKTITTNVTNAYFSFTSGSEGGRTFRIKDMKVKPL